MKVYIQITLLYALLVLIGGLIGYIKAQSFASLVMSLSSVAALGLSCWLMMKNKRAGYFLALAVIGILGLFFVYRFVMTVKLMPAGIMALASMFAALAFAHYRKKLGDPGGE